mmetsp:Transcript_41280/g.110352  ORF Transcript_41280/g.110352 Transcript_41280/m.110352 type:complete len:103 (+) Transcript_41280:290-598(+)
MRSPVCVCIARPTCARMNRNARRLMEERHGLVGFGQAYADLYTAVAGSRSEHFADQGVEAAQGGDEVCWRGRLGEGDGDRPEGGDDDEGPGTEGGFVGAEED